MELDRSSRCEVMHFFPAVRPGPFSRPDRTYEWTLELWGLRESLNVQSFLTKLFVLQALFGSNRHVIRAHFALLFSFLPIDFIVPGCFPILDHISRTGLWS